MPRPDSRESATSSAATSPDDHLRGNSNKLGRRRELFSRQTLLIAVLFTMVSGGLFMHLVLDLPAVHNILAIHVGVLGALTLVIGHLIRVRLRASIRGWLVFIVLISIVLALFGRKFADLRAEKNAVEWIAASGGKVTYAGIRFDPIEKVVKTGDGSHVPPWLVEALGDNFFAAVQSVQLNGAEFNDQTIERLGDLRRIHSLAIRTTQITERGLAELPRIAGLETLSCGWHQLSAESLERLREFSDLREISVGGASLLIDSTGAPVATPVAMLGQLRQLESVSVSALTFTVEDAGALIALPNLKTLSIDQDNRGATFPENGRSPILALAKSEALESILLRQNRDITDEEFESLARIPSLKVLDLQRRPSTSRLSISVEAQRRVREARPDLTVSIY